MLVALVTDPIHNFADWVAVGIKRVAPMANSPPFSGDSAIAAKIPWCLMLILQVIVDPTERGLSHRWQIPLHTPGDSQNAISGSRHQCLWNQGGLQLSCHVRWSMVMVSEAMSFGVASVFFIKNKDGARRCFFNFLSFYCFINVAILLAS